MKNIIKSIIALLTLTSAFVVSGCSDITNGTKHEQDSLQGCTVSGKVFLSSTSGATTSQLFSTSSSARTAVASFSEKDSLTYSVGAKYADETAKIPDEIGSFDTETMTYSIKFTKTGEWTIVVEAIAADAYKLLEGKTTVSINSVFGDVQNNPITMYPQASSDKTGSVVLSVTDQSTKIKSVSATAIYGGNAAIAAIDETKLTGYKNFTDGVAALNMPGVPAGAYDVTFCFNDAENGAGNTLYKCKETINVYSGFATDTWYGTSPHMTRNTDGTYSFVITDNLISGYGTELVNTTEIIQYEKYKENPEYSWYSGYEYKLANSESIKTTSSNINSFFFDETGNFYVISKVENKNIDSGGNGNWRDCITHISSNNQTFGQAGKASFGGENIDSIRGFSSIQYDKVTKKFYGIVTNMKNDGGTYTYTNDLYEYPLSVINAAWNWASIEEGVEKHYIIEGISSQIYNFAIHNGVLYIPYNDSDGFYLLIADLSLAVPDSNDNYVRVEDYGSIALNLSEVSGNITDCIYQDENVYFLIKDSSLSNPQGDIKSRGAVVRINLFNKKVDYTGWTSDSLDKNSTYLYALSPIMDNGNCIGHKFYTTEANSKEPHIIAKASDLYRAGASEGTESDHRLGNIYCPSESDADSVFYGPKKFIAIKPKKLIIADDGIALYTDAYGALCYKNSNRVVTVDLERFAITESSKADVFFDEDNKGVLINDCTYGHATSSIFYNADTMDDISSTTEIYVEESSEVEEWGIECFSVPCMDN